MCASKTPRVLSIQSHVVSGYVGNKSATFPLQLLGFEVDAINSVQLSNHTGYKVFKGQVLNDKDLDVLVDGLVQNNLDQYTHLLTGYVGSASFLRRIKSVVHTLKQKNPNLVYVCDPVMGDNGKMYVPEELKDIYKNEIVPVADILTPNQFELELLTGNKVSSMSDIQNAIKELHKKGPSIVAVSSIENNGNLTALVSSTKELICEGVINTWLGNLLDNTLLKIDIPKIPTNYTGSGDLFAALFLAHTYLQTSMKVALEYTVNSLHEVLTNTYKHSEEFDEKDCQPARRLELRLIQSKENIQKPSIRLLAEHF